MFSCKAAELYELKRFLDSVGSMRMSYSINDSLRYLSLNEKLELFGYFRENVAVDSEPKLCLVSDIDDTLVCAIRDRSYPHGTKYPGLTEFLKRFYKITFLSARPRSLAKATVSFLKKRGLNGPVMFGSLTRIFSSEHMAERKWFNLTLYMNVFCEPNFRWVFLGDCGQGDAAVAKMMLEGYESEKDKPIALIHNLRAKKGVAMIPLEE